MGKGMGGEENENDAFLADRHINSRGKALGSGRLEHSFTSHRGVGKRGGRDEGQPLRKSHGGCWEGQFEKRTLGGRFKSGVDEGSGGRSSKKKNLRGTF